MRKQLPVQCRYSSDKLSDTGGEVLTGIQEVPEWNADKDPVSVVRPAVKVDSGSAHAEVEAGPHQLEGVLGITAAPYR